MKSKPVFITRGFAALLVAGGLAVASVPVLSQPETDGNAVTKQERLRKHIDHRLDKMESRLSITPAQQAAWTQYRNTVEAQFGTPPARPATDADAVTLVRWRAERASDFARKLSVIADATETLQNALDVEQRKTLSKLVRHDGRGDRRHKNHDDGKPTAAR